MAIGGAKMAEDAGASGNFITQTLSCQVDRIDCSLQQFSPSVYCPDE
jgi:hypothetical protein